MANAFYSLVWHVIATAKKRGKGVMSPRPQVRASQTASDIEIGIHRRKKGRKRYRIEYWNTDRCKWLPYFQGYETENGRDEALRRLQLGRSGWRDNMLFRKKY